MPRREPEESEKSEFPASLLRQMLAEEKEPGRGLSPTVTRFFFLAHTGTWSMIPVLVS